MDRRDRFARPGNSVDLQAWCGMDESARSAEQDEVMVAPFGVPAVMRGVVWSFETTGALLRK